MVPFEIDPVEATANLAMALGFAKAEQKPGVYICMQGCIAPHERLVKNKVLGRFELAEG
jgi:L-asparaginase